MLGGFLQALLTALHRPDLSCQAYFTKYHGIPVNRFVLKAGYDGEQQCKVSTGLTDLDTTHYVNKNILIRHVKPTVPMQYGQQHGKPVLFQSNRYSARITEWTGINQGLNLYQKGSGAFP